jgi:amphi-Trp domain-containing protein
MPEETVHESERKRKRRSIASYLRRIAKALRRGDPVPADEEGTVTVDPPEETELAVEVEREDGDLSLELEMEWEEGEDDVDLDAAASKATFEVYEDNAGEARWRLRHRNGNIIADGGEGYSSAQKARQGIDSVVENAPAAVVVDETRDESADDFEGGSDAVFEIFEDNAGEYRWRLVHDNGNIIADSGEGYTAKASAKNGLRSVKENAPGAAVEDADEE